MTAEIGHKDYACTCDMVAEEQVKYRYKDSDDSCCSSGWKKQTGFTMKGTMRQGGSRNSSKRKPNNALAEYKAKLAAKAKVNLKE